MTEANQEESDYQRLAKAAQRLAKALGDGGEAKSSEPKRSEVDRLSEQLEALEGARSDDLVELAQRVLEVHRERVRGLQARVESLKQERKDVTARRNALAAAATGYDWAAVYQTSKDFLGPFTIDNAPDSTTISLCRGKKVKLAFPSGEEVFAAVNALRAELAESVDATLESLAKCLPTLQPTPETYVPWPKWVEALDSKEAPFKKKEGAVLFTLALMRIGKVPGWSLAFKVPALSQQRESVDLPRIDRPGNPERIAALRLTRAGP